MQQFAKYVNKNVHSPWRNDYPVLDKAYIKFDGERKFLDIFEKLDLQKMQIYESVFEFSRP